MTPPPSTIPLPLHFYIIVKFPYTNLKNSRNLFIGLCQRLHWICNWVWYPLGFPARKPLLSRIFNPLPLIFVSNNSYTCHVPHKGEGRYISFRLLAGGAWRQPDLHSQFNTPPPPPHIFLYFILSPCCL